MTLKDRIQNEYFEWMFDMVCGIRYSKEISYMKLLSHLHNTKFVYSVPMDENRAADGVSLRYRFAYERDDLASEVYLEGPCSVLEMMIALVMRCEEDIMDDPHVGNRIPQWFWGMITNLGLGSMTDAMYDKDFVNEKLLIFLNREYEPDGRGGLFRIKNCDRDLRTVEIWHQLCWYLDSIV